MSEVQLGLTAGTAVAVEEKAVLFIGKSGSGKSGAALQMMAFGASLIGDEMVHLTQHTDHILVEPIKRLPGHIEARGIGILQVEYQKSAQLKCVVDLDQKWDQRLPDERRCDIGVTSVPLIFGGELPNLSFAIYQFLLGKRID